MGPNVAGQRPLWWHNATLRTTAAVAGGWEMYERVHRRTERDTSLLAAVRTERLAAVLDLVHEHSGQLRRGVLSNRSSPWRALARLPILTKRDFVSRQAELRTGLIADEDVLRVHTSGTTGEPVTIEHDDGHLVHGVADTLRMYAAYGVQPGLRLLRVTCDKRHGLCHFGSSLVSGSYLRINVAKIDDGNDDFVNRLVAAFAPQVLWGQPMELLVLGSKIAEGRLSSLPTPELVLSHGDTVDHQTRAALAAVLCAPVRDLFGLQEFGQVAWECPEETGTYHLNEEKVHVERDEDGRLLMTSLVNKATMIVRYRPEDQAELLDEPCSCGRALRRLRGIQGRQRGFVADRLENLVNVKPLQLYLESLPLARWQVRQRVAGRLEVRVAPLPAREAERDTVDTSRIAAMLNLDEVSVEWVDMAQLLTTSGKSVQFDLHVTQRRLAEHLLERS
ncbi:hypothetical protein NLX83_04220 [Allokutzneria sp. A3M-2-11 16]|uniref:phenylacetate--CoA ligase family protein n=1 Tax=Allokutzneria sp. A3M-2-11 16 TaxID=2962043 RepID=UPI0020B75977|nr:hypothetical protein [Allokutzneria sp. A3M-2-11 16]MCP3798460.1 hypothetical protein [Allokutzneria sp. A3M-2-11 16]